MAALKRVLEGINTQKSSRAYCNVKTNTINEYWSQLKAINQSIWEAAEDVYDCYEYDPEEYYRVEEATQDILAKLLQRSEEISTSNMDQARSNISSQMKLPKISLPQFDGDYLKWKQFHDLFSQMVHEQDIGGAQKMWFLKTNLTGEAERLIRHLPISDANYSTAWDTLTKRYNNKRLLTRTLLEKLLGQQVTTPDSSISIKRLHDTTRECIMALNNLGIPTDTWDPILLHLLLKKVDKSTHVLYEQGLQAPRDLQSVEQFLKFLELRFQALETLGSQKADGRFINKSSVLVTGANSSLCKTCQKQHGLFACPKFLKLSPIERRKMAYQLKVCTNCLKSSHQTTDCPARGCLKCNQKHNTLLHQQFQPKRSDDQSVKSIVQPTTSTKEPSASLAAGTKTLKRNYVLLGTVLIMVPNNKGETIQCRAILDSGSQLNFITERLARKLGLRKSSETMLIQGIGEIKQRTQHRMNLQVMSRINNFTARIEAFVLPEITSAQPTHEIETESWSIPRNIELADPSFNCPGKIDLLIGADLYHQLLSVGQIRLGSDLPILQNTVFGWVAAGTTPHLSQQTLTCAISTAEDINLETQVEKFWQLEEAQSASPKLTAEQARCEHHFQNTVKRDNTGRFIVKLPFYRDPNELGESKDVALRRFLALERKFDRNPSLYTQYTDFMKEYRELDHMREIDVNIVTKPYYFLPHHAVVKPDSTTTKLRVVFDGSCKSSSNNSLNDILSTGPTVQNDLFSILLRFRIPRFVFTADIEKMYRQILVDPEDQKFQLIWWRDNSTKPIKCFSLRTVTYGTTSAPYLATRCLQQLGKEVEATYPLASATIERDFYVDDLMTGTNSLVEALQLQRQLQEALKSGGFKLRKWCANHPQLLQSFSREDKALQFDIYDSEQSIKTLGLTWTPHSDEFCIKTLCTARSKVTKRTVLSDIAHLFDPLGILGPVIVSAKIFLQTLWRLKLDWDASLPMELHTFWTNFHQELQSLARIKIPRHMFSATVPASVQLHAFADASEKAYGAAIYLRSINHDKVTIVRLLCSKSRVAPAKPCTLPRLELCAAKLTAELASRVRSDLNVKDIQCYYWTDSKITLAWINSDPALYHTFIANRIASIQEISSPEQWRHVSSKENPADLVSRGVHPEKLASQDIWFYGPLFLHGTENHWPPKYIKSDTELEKRRPKTILTVFSEDAHFVNTIEHQNSFSRWQRIVGYVLRFTQNCRPKYHSRNTNQKLTIKELDDATTIIIKSIQQKEFREELSQLHRTGYVHNSSPMSSLTPFIDNQGLIRVGGRLEAANLPLDAKHPILLPYAHSFTKLLMTHLHESNLHCAPQTLLATTRQRYWPIKGKTIARSIVGRCIRCAKAKPKLLNQFMGNLPAHRIQPARPFMNAGVDFLGPIWIHFNLRGKRPQKAYIAVFCCFATKAVHFEVASDLSTAAFIGCLKRFVGRRGSCSNLYCDNATNFVGAKNQLKELEENLHHGNSQQLITSYCTTKGIQFHFIPPRAPHFGGLWEAAVKSAKYFLQRNIGSASLTYVELETLMIEIEAILNSRPLTPLSSDPNDLSALTPGHFLIGEPINTAADPMAQPSRSSLSQRWKQVFVIKNQFWQRWSKEYLSELQHRYKWKQESKNVRPGMMVVIKEENLPTTQWQLGRIIETVRGQDGLVRVADVRTASGTLRRPIHKLAPLPVEDDSNSTHQMPDDPLTNEDAKQQTSRSEHTQKRKALSNASSTSTASTSEGATSHKRRHRQNGATSLLLLTCLILPVFCQVRINEFKAQPGIYFEPMGNAHLISNEWTLVVHYNMSPVWEEYETIRCGISNLSNLCNIITDKISCEPILDQFQGFLTEMQNGNELLLHSHKKVRSRTKRAPLNIIGSLANSLFGVLDSEYANHMSEVIEKMKSSDHYLLELIKNQTTVIDSTANVIQRSQERTESQFMEFHKYFNTTISQLNNLTHEAHQQKIIQIFTTISLRLMMAINNYQRIQSTLWDVLIDTHQGKINPYLLAPRQFNKELNYIQEHLPSSLRLPAKPEDLIKLYSIMSVEGRATPSQMIFRLTLPLFTSEQFEMRHLVSLPFIRNNTLMMIQPSTEFLIINLHRDQYYPLLENELRSCRVGESGFICKQHHPIYNKQSNRSLCEISLLTQSTPRNCLLTSAQSLRWIQLATPNQWIYLMPTRTTINIVCEGSVHQEVLEGSGILEISPQCSVRDESTTIRGHNIISSYLEGQFITTPRFTDFIRTLNNTDIQYEVSPAQSIMNDIQELQKGINALKEGERLTPEDINLHDTHQYTIGYTSLLLILGLIIYVLWRCKQHGFGQQTRHPRPPVPLPRTTSLGLLHSEDLEPAQRGENVQT